MSCFQPINTIKDLEGISAVKQETIPKLRFATTEIKLRAQRVTEILRFLDLCKLIAIQKQQITK